MIALICLLCPAVLAVGLFEKLMKQDLSLKGWIYRFSVHAVAVNGIVFLIKKIILGTSAAPLYTLGTDMTPEVAIRYLIMALPVAVLLAVFEVLLRKNTKVSVEEDD